MLQFTAESMKDENMSGLVLVDFWAPWCGPCRMAAPILEQLSEEYEGKVTFGKLNIDDYPEVAVSLGVMSSPTLILFKDGKEIDRIIGMGHDLFIKADGRAQSAHYKGDIYLCKNFTTHIFNELRDDFCGRLSTGDTVAVYIKSIIPDRMKIKLVIVDAGGERAEPSPPKYFIDKNTLHMPYWRYSPTSAPKLIESIFE